MLRGASVGVGAISSCIGLYKLLKDKLEAAGVDELEAKVQAIREKDMQEQRIKALREQLAEEERKLKEMDSKTRKEGQ
jgi:hypothetical protein